MRSGEKTTRVKQLSTQPEKLKGEVKRITFSSPETGFTVAEVRVDAELLPITIVGNLGNVFPGQVLHMEGMWELHPRFGKRFKVHVYSRILPQTKKAIEKYLGSGLINGIGPVLAERIVKKFGEDTLKVIDESPNKLLKVDGIGEKRLALIKRAWEEQRGMSSLMVFLKEHDLGTALAFKIMKRYGNQALSTITENPYRLAWDIPGVGFKTADKIAMKMGIDRDSTQRLEAGIIFRLTSLAEQGHVYYPLESVVRLCSEFLGVGEKEVSRALELLTSRGELVIEQVVGHSSHRKKELQAVFLKRYHLAETATATHIRRLMAADSRVPKIDAHKAIEWIRRRISINLVARQIDAIEKALTNKLLIVTGGPGTGKTTIIKAIIEIFRAKKATVLLAAPTGRASKRMEEAAAMEAKTIHRLLEFSWDIGGFARNEDNPLEADLVIVDEASMIDVSLMAHLLRAIPSEARLVLVGDVDQLPSVGPGNVLKDMISSGKIPVVRLTDIFRQAKKSLITVNAHRINHGKMPILPSQGERLQDFYLIEQHNPNQVLNTVLELVCRRIPERFSMDPVRDIQVLCPMHRGVVGTEELNRKLQKALNPNGRRVQVGSRSYGIGDKVMQIRNDYEKEVFNGDIGYVKSLDTVAGQLTVSFDSREVSYRFAELDDLALAYAISVHKSQGSEYRAVVLPLISQHYLMLQRNLIYTAITRARKLLVIVGSKRALSIAVTNEKPSKRYTLLAQRLKRL